MTPAEQSAKPKNRLRELRQEKGEETYDLAVLIRRDPSVITRYENGLTNIPLQILAQLCEHYDVSADFLLGWSDKRRKAAA
jgi:transcriptional regulator with XRE-family HTH domain